jgi:hypothetical protein
MAVYYLSGRERIHLGTCRYCRNGKGPDWNGNSEVWEGRLEQESRLCRKPNGEAIMTPKTVDSASQADRKLAVPAFAP